MIIRIGDISPKSRHNTPILLYMSDKTGHIGKLGHMQKKTPDTLTMASNDKHIGTQTDFTIGLRRPNQQCNRTSTKTSDKEQKGKSTSFGFLKTLASTQLQSCIIQPRTQAMRKSAILAARNNGLSVVLKSNQYFRLNKTQMEEDISLVDLAKKESLTVRSVNVCENAGLTSLSKILRYFRANGTFTKIRNCGSKTDQELIGLCEKTKSPILTDDSLAKRVEVLTIFNDLGPLKKSIINRHIQHLASTLSVRGQNGLKSISDSIVSKKILYRIFDPSFDFIDIRNIGQKTVDELNLFKKKLFNFIHYLKELNEEKLTKEYAKLIVRTNFADLPEDFEKHLELVFDENGKLKLFKLIDLLSETEQLFNKKEKQLFLFLYSNLDQDITLETISTKIQLTRERARQIKVHLLKKLPNYLKFISNFKPDDFVSYEIESSPTFIVIDRFFANKLNQREGVDFNSLFYSLVFGIIYKNLYTVFADGKALIGKNNLKSRNRYKHCYLISNPLVESFDFESFIKDINRRISDKITESYSLHFAGYLCQYLRNDEHKNLTSITDVCEAIIFNEFDLVVGHDRYIRFERNTKKQLHEYALEILCAKGELMTVDEIVKAIKLKYPEYGVNPSSIRSSMIREKELFLHIGRSSTYGLKKWENEQDNLRGGTIRDIVEEFLVKESEPKHISEIMNYVLQYRDSDGKSIMTNIKVDESNRFIFYDGNFVGLKNKSYSEDSIDFKRVAGSLFSQRILKKYNGWGLNELIDHYVAEYGYQPVQIKHIIERRINENKIIITSDNRILI